MTSEIALCRDHWKYRSKISLAQMALCRGHWKYRNKISLPQMALHRYWNSNLRVYARELAVCS
jgi:hypothetical protein